MRVSENMYSCIFYASVKNIQCKKKNNCECANLFFRL